MESGNDDEDGQNLYFLHGTSLRTWGRSIAIDPEAGRGDFGYGFYTFADDEEGRTWASDRAVQASHGLIDLPVVIGVKISVAEFARLSRIDFRDPRYAPGWKQFVKDCRAGRRRYAYKDVVIGPVSDGSVDNPSVHSAITIPQYKFEAGGADKLKFAFVYPAGPSE